MELQKGDLFELPYGYGFVIFKRTENKIVYFYCLNSQRENWHLLDFFAKEANKLG
jgi:hypothetical protein